MVRKERPSPSLELRRAFLHEGGDALGEIAAAPGLALSLGPLRRLHGEPLRAEKVAEMAIGYLAHLALAAETVDVVPIGVGNQLFVSVAMTTAAADQVTIATGGTVPR